MHQTSILMSPFNLYAQHQGNQTSVELRTLMTRPPSIVLPNKINKSPIYLSLTLNNQRQTRFLAKKDKHQVRSSTKNTWVKKKLPPKYSNPQPKHLSTKNTPNITPHDPQLSPPNGLRSRKRRVARCRWRDPWVEFGWPRGDFREFQ